MHGNRCNEEAENSRTIPKSTRLSRQSCISPESGLKRTWNRVDRSDFGGLGGLRNGPAENSRGKIANDAKSVRQTGIRRSGCAPTAWRSECSNGTLPRTQATAGSMASVLRKRWRSSDGPVFSREDDDIHGERRERSYGLMQGVVVVCVVHTDRRAARRIISARKATKKERERFHAYLTRAIG